MPVMMHWRNHAAVDVADGDKFPAVFDSLGHLLYDGFRLAKSLPLYLGSRRGPELAIDAIEAAVFSRYQIDPQGESEPS